jgi:hypothetical protein
MAEREKRELPNWGERERAGDLAWIQDNLHIFWPAAQLGFQTVGRGAIVVYTTMQPTGKGHPFGYWDQAAIETVGDEDSQRLVREYDPNNEFVTSLLKTEERVSSYRLRMVPAKASENSGNQVEPDHQQEEPPETDPEPPDLETLKAWADEGGCEAACPHGCWVEADGACSHGHPSWLLKLGLI